MDYRIDFLKKDDGLLDCIISYSINGIRYQKRKRGFKTHKEAKPWINKLLKELGFDSLEERNRKHFDKITKE